LLLSFVFRRRATLWSKRMFLFDPPPRGGTQPRRLIAGSCRCEIALPEREAALGHPRRARRLPLGDRLWQANTAPFRDYSKATGQLGLESQRRGSEMSQNAGSEEAERHGTRFSALFLGMLSTQSRIGPGCLATVSPFRGIYIRRTSAHPYAEGPQAVIEICSTMFGVTCFCRRS